MGERLLELSIVSRSAGSAELWQLETNPQEPYVVSGMEECDLGYSHTHMPSDIATNF
jgi:hypothetical protein